MSAFTDCRPGATYTVETPRGRTEIWDYPGSGMAEVRTVEWEGWVVRQKFFAAAEWRYSPYRQALGRYVSEVNA